MRMKSSDRPPAGDFPRQSWAEGREDGPSSIDVGLVPIFSRLRRCRSRNRLDDFRTRANALERFHKLPGNDATGALGARRYLDLRCSAS